MRFLALTRCTSPSLNFAGCYKIRKSSFPNFYNRGGHHQWKVFFHREYRHHRDADTKPSWSTTVVQVKITWSTKCVQVVWKYNCHNRIECCSKANSLIVLIDFPGGLNHCPFQVFTSVLTLFKILRVESGWLLELVGAKKRIDWIKLFIITEIYILNIIIFT